MCGICDPSWLELFLKLLIPCTSDFLLSPCHYSFSHLDLFPWWKWGFVDPVIRQTHIFYYKSIRIHQFFGDFAPNQIFSTYWTFFYVKVLSLYRIFSLDKLQMIGVLIDWVISVILWLYIDFFLYSFYVFFVFLFTTCC